MAFGDNLVECAVHYCGLEPKMWRLREWNSMLTATVNVERRSRVEDVQTQAASSSRQNHV